MQILGDAQIPRIQYGNTAYGSVLLKSLQTEKLPELDLLVREAVQNSSDASIGVGADNFWIDFNFSTFDIDGLCGQLGAVGSILRDTASKYTSFLEIRDRKTSGLTGPYDKELLHEKDHGNYFKLIFDSGINQTQEGAGGNWGFGKSVYYRVGKAGIVVYYSRIDDGANGGQQERLIVTMVEDQSSDESVLRHVVQNPTGRAWWGRKETDPEVVWPIVDPNEIAEFLRLFGLKRFKDGDTGTSIIIPFIDEQRILEDIIPSGGITDDERNRCTWKNSVPEYIDHALKKWYAPRLHNLKLKDSVLLANGTKWIRATVNGKMIRRDEMDPFFRLVQDLYTTALFRCRSISSLETGQAVKIETKEIRLRGEGLERSVVGCVAYARVSNRELYAGQAGINPYVLTGNFKNNDDENEPIVMFAREPGMVISYSIDGTWSRGVRAPGKNAGSSNEEFILAFFVPMVDNHFESGKSAGRDIQYQTLGGYLRACEESDHANWDDKAKYKTISKMKLNVAKKIAEGAKIPDPELISASASRLSGRLGRALLPARGALEKSVKRKGKTGTRKTSSGGSRLGFTTEDPIWRKGHIVIPFEMGMGSKECRRIRVEVQAEAGTISPEKWVEQIGGTFPIRFVAASANLKKKNGTTEAAACGHDASSVMEGPLTCCLKCEAGVSTVVEVSCSVPGQLISGELELAATDKTIECVLKAM